MKLTTLKARVPTLGSRLPKVDRIEVDRLRGRAAVTRRARWLEAHPLCEEAGRVVVATVPDHIVALVNGGTDTEDNLQSLCAEHHRIKTAKDLGHRARRTVGADGWPE
jgi:5-methylcytosine-specific restriction protein A